MRLMMRLKEFFNKIINVVKYIVGGLILYFVGGTIVMLVYQVIIRDQKTLEDYEANSAQIIKQATEFIDTKKYGSAREYLKRYKSVEDAKLDELNKRNDIEHIAALKAQIAGTAPNEYKKRIQYYKTLISFEAGNTQKHREAKARVESKWDELKDKIVTFEDDCASDYAKILANNMLQTFVKKRLIAPASASFPWPEPNAVKVTKPCDFEIIGYVDSQNRYGAMVRKYYTGKLTRNLKDKDVFTLLHLEM